MSKRQYTHVQALLPEIKAMVAAGKTQREIAEHFGLKDKYVVKQLLTRERRKEAKIKSGIMPRPKGRPPKDAPSRDIVAEQAYEINRLKRENNLLRDFLQLTEKEVRPSVKYQVIYMNRNRYTISEMCHFFKWVTDISYIHTGQGVLYLSIIRDLFDNSIVAYKTGTTQSVEFSA